MFDPDTQTPALKVEPPVQEDELAYPRSSRQSGPSQTSPISQAEAPAPASPPAPRRRTRSNSSQALQAAPPTRTLRSRSKTPAPVPAPSAPPPASQNKTPPLPRRTTRSRASSADGHANVQAQKPPQTAPENSTATVTGGPRRATSKPPSSAGPGGKRAGSAGPGTRRTTRANPSGLAAVDEQPDEGSLQLRAAGLSEPAPVPASAEAQRTVGTATRGTFRSGVLPLPRRSQVVAQLAASQSQFESQSQAAVTGEGEVGAMKLEPDAGPSASQIQAQGGDEGGYREGYGFDISFGDLLTQRPFPSQGWGSSQ